MARLTVADNDADLARRAAARLTELIDGAADAHGQALMSLTGGSTPRALYSTLADPQQPWRERIPWPRVHLFWGDERHVPPDHPDSNYGMAKATLIDHVPIPDAQIHRMHGEIPDAHEAAVDYERTLNSVMSGLSRSDDVTSAFPQSNGLASAFRRKSFFDVMLLGVGADAHIASLFPGSEFLDPDIGRPSTPNQPDVGRRVAAVWAAHLNAWRITLTPGAILDSGTIVMLVAGAKKAAAMHAAFAEPLDVKRYPVQLLRAASDRVEWFLDHAAASRL
jgi:6-phosphogluconolactonase